MINAAVYLAACWQEHEVGIVFQPRKPRGERLDHELHPAKRLVRKKRNSETPHHHSITRTVPCEPLFDFT